MLFTVLVVQLAAVFLGSAAIYTCVGGDPTLSHPVLRSLWLGLAAPLYVMLLLGAPITLVVILILSLSIYFARRWQRVRFLWIFGMLLWVAWWVWCAYVICIPD